MRTKQSTLNLHSIPDQKGYFCKRREIWRETHAPMWLLIGRVIFVTREKSFVRVSISRNGIERLVCITGIYTQNDPANPRWITMLRPFMRSFINDMVLMENTVMKSNLIYTIMRPPILTKGKCLFDKPPMQTFLVLVTRSSPPTFVGEDCVTSKREATL